MTWTFSAPDSSSEHKKEQDVGEPRDNANKFAVQKTTLVRFPSNRRAQASEKTRTRGEFY